MKKRITIIMFAIMLFIGAVVIVGSAFYSPNELEEQDVVIDYHPFLPNEGGAFSRSDMALDYLNMPESSRSMSTYYDNRAYPGAPPVIPHPLFSPKGIGGKSCLQCHENGGFTPSLNAYAPVTPHPEWHNCRQCHVAKITESLFKPTDFIKPTPPTLGVSALSTSPIIMPHGLEGRENCLSCHAGPGAPKEIRVTHPERINCRQCHVPATTRGVFYKDVMNILPKAEDVIGNSQGNLLDTLRNSEMNHLKLWVNSLTPNQHIK